MNTAIIYMSKHGTTEKVAQLIGDELKTDSISLIDLRKNKSPNINNFDLVIIGGSIHAGFIQKRVKNFCIENHQLLSNKMVALFVCGMLFKEKTVELEKAFPPELSLHASEKAFLGGEFIFEKMNFLEKMIIKKVSKIEKSTSQIDKQTLNKFIKSINTELAIAEKH